jgi:hypothetical protein
VDRAECEGVDVALGAGRKGKSGGVVARKGREGLQQPIRTVAEADDERPPSDACFACQSHHRLDAGRPRWSPWRWPTRWRVDSPRQGHYALSGKAAPRTSVRQEIRRPRFVGYVFVRPLPWCPHDPNRLFELHGCSDIVTLGGKAARVEDFDIEIMRIAEARGTFDTVVGGGARGRYRVTAVGLDQRWTGQGKQLLDCAGAKTLHLAIDALGRIEQLVDQANGVRSAPVGPAHSRDISHEFEPK